LIMNYVVNVIVTTLLDFHIFWGEWIQDDYVKKFRPRSCMFMQKIRLGWFHSFLMNDNPSLKNPSHTKNFKAIDIFWC
jgi:hypothetical protein